MNDTNTRESMFGHDSRYESYHWKLYKREYIATIVPSIQNVHKIYNKFVDQCIQSAPASRCLSTTAWRVSIGHIGRRILNCNLQHCWHQCLVKCLHIYKLIIIYLILYSSCHLDSWDVRGIVSLLPTWRTQFQLRPSALSDNCSTLMSQVGQQLTECTCFQLTQRVTFKIAISNRRNMSWTWDVLLYTRTYCTVKNQKEVWSTTIAGACKNS